MAVVAQRSCKLLCAKVIPYIVDYINSEIVVLTLCAFSDTDFLERERERHSFESVYTTATFRDGK